MLDAKPMNQVGFRDVSPTPPTSGGSVKPEITVVAARPMSEVGFRSEGSDNKSPDEQEVCILVLTVCSCRFVCLT